MLLAIVIAGAKLALPGRTPSSGFLRTAFGHESVRFDQVYESTGSSENRSRVVIVATSLSLEAVLANLEAEGDWRRLGSSLERRSDGLCVVPWTAADYVSTHPSRVDATAVARALPKAVVIVLLYC